MNKTALFVLVMFILFQVNAVTWSVRIWFLIVKLMLVLKNVINAKMDTFSIMKGLHVGLIHLKLQEIVYYSQIYVVRHVLMDILKLKILLEYYFNKLYLMLIRILIMIMYCYCNKHISKKLLILSSTIKSQFKIVVLHILLITAQLILTLELVYLVKVDFIWVIITAMDIQKNLFLIVWFTTQDLRVKNVKMVIFYILLQVVN